MAANVAIIVTLQGILSVAREELMSANPNPDDEDMLTRVIKNGTLNSGMLGIAAIPIMTVLSVTKYGSSTANLVTGAGIASIAGDVNKILSAAFGKNSEDTNTGEITAAKAAFRLMIAPFVNAAVANVPASGIVAKAAKVISINFGTSPKVAQEAAEFMYGSPDG